MAEIKIPTGPLAQPPPMSALRPADDETLTDAKNAAIREALDGVVLGAYDQAIIGHLSHFEMPTVATICSWIARARAAETEGKVVLDEVAEVGITDEDGSEVLAIVGREIVVYPGGVHEFAMGPDEAEEWARHLATMARALRQQAAARGDS